MKEVLHYLSSSTINSTLVEESRVVARCCNAKREQQVAFQKESGTTSSDKGDRLPSASKKSPEPISTNASSSSRMVLSYGLYGNDPKCTSGVPTKASLKYPMPTPVGWEVQVYHNEQVPIPLLAQLANILHETLVQVDSWLGTQNGQSNVVAVSRGVGSNGTTRLWHSRPTRREKAHWQRAIC